MRRNTLDRFGFRASDFGFGSPWTSGLRRPLSLPRLGPALPRHMLGFPRLKITIRHYMNLGMAVREAIPFCLCAVGVLPCLSFPNYYNALRVGYFG